jgi:hypothetical protein
MKLKKIILFLVFVFSYAINAKASQSARTFLVDSTKKDTLVKIQSHSPRTATILALALPGAGQIYNHKYWKVPIVYTGLGIAIYSFIQNQNSLNEMNDTFRNMFARGLTPSRILTAQRDGHRINRDVSIIAISVVYVLQVIDATVDAHFYKFDINQSLSARLNPSPTTFLSFTYKIK